MIGGWILGATALGAGGYYALVGLREKRRQVDAALGEAQHAASSAREALAHTEAAVRNTRQVIQLVPDGFVRRTVGAGLLLWLGPRTAHVRAGHQGDHAPLWRGGRLCGGTPGAPRNRDGAGTSWLVRRQEQISARAAHHWHACCRAASLP